MPSRRRVLGLCGLATASALAGCSLGRAERMPVTVLLQNDDTEARELRVTVEDEAGERVFRTTETVPPDSGEDLGEVRIEEAFGGTAGEQFTVEARFEGETVGPFEYEITCDEENLLSLLVEHRPAESGGGPVDYVARRCGA